MQDEDKKFDVAVIGGGPAGMMAAIQSARKGLRVVLLEKNKTLGKKLLLTGGGRCNLTNAEFNLKKLVANYHNGEFLYHAFDKFGPKQVIEFFENLGVKTKIENNNKVFPKSDEASEILDALKKCLAKNKVEIIYGAEVVNIEPKNYSNVLKNTRTAEIAKIVLNDGKEIVAKKYILATGGKSYAQTGSDGFGYKLAEKLGHTIVKPSPTLCPIILKPVTISPKASSVGDLQGISLKNIRINIFLNNKKQFSEDGEIMFTQSGISGPTALNASGQTAELLELGKVKICLDLFPDLNQEEVLKSFQELLEKYPKQIIKNILCEFAPERFVEIFLNILEKSNPPSPKASAWRSKIANNMSKIEKTLIVKNLKNFEMTAEDDFACLPAGRGFEGAMVTRGGISLKEIDHKTLQSKIIDNLFFAGEIIDVDGKTGGFNLQMCWSTGFIAG